MACQGGEASVLNGWLSGLWGGGGVGTANCPQPPAPPFLSRSRFGTTSPKGASFLGCPMDSSMSSTLARPRKLHSRRGEKPYVNLVFLYLDLPGIAAETELMRDCFGDRLGDRLGVVWRPESNANQPKHTTSNQMHQTTATQSNAIE